MVGDKKDFFFVVFIANFLWPSNADSMLWKVGSLLWVLRVRVRVEVEGWTEFSRLGFINVIIDVLTPVAKTIYKCYRVSRFLTWMTKKIHMIGINWDEKEWITWKELGDRYHGMCRE